MIMIIYIKCVDRTEAPRYLKVTSAESADWANLGWWEREKCYYFVLPLGGFSVNGLLAVA